MRYQRIDTPEGIATSFVEAWNQRDAQRIAFLFTEKADFINVTGLWWQDSSAIEKAHDYGLKFIFQDSSLKLIRVKVNYLSKEIAVLHAKMRLSGQSSTTEVAEPGVRRNIFTFVVQLHEEGWRCVAAHNTDIVPNMETMVRGQEGSLKPAEYRKQKNVED